MKHQIAKQVISLICRFGIMQRDTEGSDCSRIDATVRLKTSWPVQNLHIGEAARYYQITLITYIGVANSSNFAM